jgi:adenylate cyclase
MAQDNFKRKLTTILSADVAGYSRLMGEDEAATVKTLGRYQQIMSALINQHRGRVVDSPGDNLLAEFASVVDAVQCAVATQKELQARNAELPENRRMQFRMGVNLGDVIEDGLRIYGDGVNIAARLESLAEPGGICISRTAFDQIETKLPFGYEYLGEQAVKNIIKPIGAYKVLMEPRVVVGAATERKPAAATRGRRGIFAGAAVLLIVMIGAAVWSFYWRKPEGKPGPTEEMAFPLPDKPSIAMLLHAQRHDEAIAAASRAIAGDPNDADGYVALASAFSFTGKAAEALELMELAEDLELGQIIEQRKAEKAGAVEVGIDEL